MQKTLRKNVENLRLNSYPGRGIIIGLSPDEMTIYQIYWIMGRSKNSRNRVFVLEENLDVRNKAFDEKKLTDPSLIIYHPIKSKDNIHIVSNGDQTNTIFDNISEGGTFEEAINKREFEPDAPNYTPRISGIVDLNDKYNIYKLSIIKSLYNNPSVCVRSIFSYNQALSGVGHCISTYTGDGTPLPSYEGEPVWENESNGIFNPFHLYDEKSQAPSQKQLKEIYNLSFAYSIFWNEYQEGNYHNDPY
ncbi:IMP cyclohydrolase-like protein [Paenibacillus sp. GP183]|nr:IMP cyclohydrolase-like protein [Paenibacillus sp. GP183]